MNRADKFSPLSEEKNCLNLLSFPEAHHDLTNSMLLFFIERENKKEADYRKRIAKTELKIKKEIITKGYIIIQQM